MLDHLTKFLGARREIGIGLLVTDLAPPQEVDRLPEILAPDPADRPGCICLVLVGKVGQRTRTATLVLSTLKTRER